MHGLLFGVFFLLATYALFVELLRAPGADTSGGTPRRGWARAYLVATAVTGWLAVLSGTYIVYPWYRAKPPAGADLHGYPRSLLLSRASTAQFHSLGMEWKEHVAFMAPMVFTMLAFVLCRYGSQIMRYPPVQRLLLIFSGTALLATAVAGAVGALLNKSAPVVGGATNQLSAGQRDTNVAR